MISVIIPLYNQAEKIMACLESLAQQTFQDFEIIIVNDGSTDNPELVVANFSRNHRSIKLTYLQQANAGSNPARNRGFREASGEYLLFCDADIEFVPDALETMVKALLAHPEASYAYSSFKLGFKTFHGAPFSAERLKAGPCIHTTALIKTKHFPGFDEKIKRFQDWDLWLTMLENNFTGVFIDRVLMTIKTGGHISQWLPRIYYRLFPHSQKVVKYNELLTIVKQKHGLT